MISIWIVVLLIIFGCFVSVGLLYKFNKKFHDFVKKHLKKIIAIASGGLIVSGGGAIINETPEINVVTYEHLLIGNITEIGNTSKYIFEFNAADIGFVKIENVTAPPHNIDFLKENKERMILFLTFVMVENNIYTLKQYGYEGEWEGEWVTI